MAGAGDKTNDEEERRLIRDITNGEHRAVAGLYDRYAALLLALARRIVGDSREAEDLVHDVFLEVWRQAADYDPERGSVRAWILMRLRSRALDRRKSPRVARSVSFETAGLADRAAPDDPTLAADRTRVRRALAALPAEQRAVLELGYYEGLSSTEIAAHIQAPVGTVKSRIASGLAKLRAGLNVVMGGAE